VSSTLGFYI